MTRRRSPSTQRFSAGPFTGTLTQETPWTPPDKLTDAYNGYCPDPSAGSEFAARPGFSLANNGNPIITPGTTFRGQGVFSFVDLNGTATNFLVMGGKLYRTDADLVSIVDVTPVGITIDSAVTTRVYGTTFITQLVITDGVNKPWIATNLSATPITGTSIRYNAADDDWAAFGPGVPYGGSLFFILDNVGGVAARSDITWSNPADASTGWQQTDFDFRWTLEQSQSVTPPLYALFGTNTQLIYFREFSIGSLSGVPGPNLQGGATHDAISRNVGCTAPQGITEFENSVYFTDAVGRPYRLDVGTGLTPTWQQLRAIFDTAETGAPNVTRIVTVAGFEPTLNLVFVAPWSSLSSSDAPPTEGYIIDARTGNYQSRLVIGPGIQFDAMGTLFDGAGRGIVVVLGSLTAPVSGSVADSGYAWVMNALAGTPDFLTTEDSTPVFLTTEDGVFLTTEGQSANWLDNGAVPRISMSPRLGYDLNTVLNVDRCNALVAGDSPVTVSAMSAAVATTVEATPTPSASQDGINRITAGFAGIQGRGATVTLSPTTAATQWRCYQTSIDAIVSRPTPEDV